MSNESCPTPPVGGPSGQTDLNEPPTPDEVQAFTQIHMGQLGDLCQWGLSGSIVTGVIMQFLANHFSSPDTIMMPALKEYIYSTENNGVSSKIRIVNFTQFDPSSGQQPSIVVKRAGQESKRSVMFDHNQVTAAQEAAGFTNYVRFIEGSHRIYVTSTVDGEVENLADEVFDSLTFLSPVFVQQLPFHDFQVVSKGEIGILDDLGNLLGIPITVNYTYEYGWSVQPLAPKIKTAGIFVS